MLYLLVFLTGAAGLIYQVVWQQYLARILGNEHAATAIVLAVFLGGLAIGYLMSGALSRGVRGSLATYAVLEGIIGLWALAFPVLFRAIDQLTARWSFASPWALVVQGSLTALLLIGIPTICMGGTVPLLTRALSATLEDATRTHARIYAVNTLGAFLGALLAGFVLIPWLGLPQTLRLAAWLNLAATGFFALRAKWTASPTPAAIEADTIETSPRKYPPAILYAVAFLSGAYVMTLENVLIRVTDLSLGPSTYSFSLIVGVFVLCIGTGSLLVGASRHRSPNALVWNQLALTLALLAVFASLDKWPYAAHVLRVGFQSNVAGFWLHKLAVLLALGIVLALPIGLAGATLPIAFHELRRSLDRVGWSSGVLFFCNLLGAVAGSLIGGWLLYLWMGNGRIFLGAVMLVGISALVAGVARNWRLGIAGAISFLLALSFLIVRPFYDPNRFAMGNFRAHTAMPETWEGPAALDRALHGKLRILDVRDGPGATVAVAESDVPQFRISAEGLLELQPPGDGPGETSRAIFVNGKSDSSTHADRETLKLLAEFGALFAEKRERALLIGLGTGVSAGEVALDPEWKEIVVAELLPEVATALPFFSAATHRVQDDSRVRIELGDAFRVLRRNPGKWDVILSEPPNLWVRGTAQLFSREFYAIAKSRLREDGVFVQWMQAYAANHQMLNRVGATLRSEFSHVTAFRGTQGDYLFVATAEELGARHYDRAAARIASNPKVRDSMAEIGIANGNDLEKRRLPAPFLQANQAEPETLDQPRLHYLAGQADFASDRTPEVQFVPPGPVQFTDPTRDTSK